MLLGLCNFLIHIAAAFMMIGIIWFVQIVHYPLFRSVGEETFQKYEQLHTKLTGWIVAPVMIVELLSGILLLGIRPASISAPAVWTGLGLLAVIWVSTMFIQVALHRKLSDGFDLSAQRRLLSTNWIRTVAWSLRGILLLWMFLKIITE